MRGSANPKIGESVARGSARRSRAGFAAWRSGRAFEYDLVAEGFELADVIAPAALGIDPGVIEA
jgi:hypothetical protein